MRNTWLIAMKEFRSHLTSPMVYVVAGIFLLLIGNLFTWHLRSTSFSDTSISGYLGFEGNLVLMLFAVVLTMRLIAEERKMGTWEMLLTAPTRDTEVVIGKFLGSLGILLAMLALTLYYPILLFAFGDPDVGPIVSSYIGLILLGMVSLSIGIFASSVTSSQVIAAVIAGGILAAMYFIGLAGEVVSGSFGDLISYISLSWHFTGFTRGIIDTQALVYYLSVTALFLFLAIRSIETSRWS